MISDDMTLYFLSLSCFIRQKNRTDCLEFDVLLVVFNALFTFPELGFYGQLLDGYYWVAFLNTSKLSPIAVLTRLDVE